MSKTEFRVDGLDELEKKLAKTIEQDFSTEFKKMVLDIAIDLQNRVVYNTPKITGDLRINWEVGEIVKKGNEYVIEVYNNLEYAEAVEHGHRQNVGQFVPALGKRLKKPFVEGKHMMEISLAEVNAKLPAHLKSWLNTFIAKHL